MSIMAAIKDLKCVGCPFFHCPDGDCYDCHCYINKNIDFGSFWCDDTDIDYHKDCPLLKGQIITIKEDNGKLIARVEYK